MSYTEWLPFEEAFARPSSGAAWAARHDMWTNRGFDLVMTPGAEYGPDTLGIKTKPALVAAVSEFAIQWPCRPAIVAASPV